MYILYLGSDPEICTSQDIETVKTLAKEVHPFNTELEARDYCQNNDNDILGYAYYSCWSNGEIVFVS